MLQAAKTPKVLTPQSSPNPIAFFRGSSDRTKYTYDAVGNRTEKDGSSTTYYTWNDDNRLTEVDPGTPINMAYNADGLRVTRETSGDTKKFIYDFQNLLKETDADDDTQETYTSTVEEYGDLISEYDGTSTDYHAYDGLGSTDALVDPAQTSTDTWVYRAFGAIESRTDPDATPFGFVGRQGYYHDPQIDLYYVNQRPYDYNTIQWVCQDRLEEGSDDTNLYRYVHNNPVNTTDPSGLQANTERLLREFREEWAKWGTGEYAPMEKMNLWHKLQQETGFDRERVTYLLGPR
ncbi:MAG: RHS repeat-associated core domain-containing protein, partial [Planctomycetota bacterium]